MQPGFLNYNELASASSGGKILFATDDFFAVAENLLKDEEPIWKEGVYTEYGKWMDGWETRRKRTAGHDWLIIALNVSALINGICVDTSFFTGNYAPKFSFQAANLLSKDTGSYQQRADKLGTGATTEDFNKIAALQSERWETIIPITKLQAGAGDSCKNAFAVTSNDTWTHLRLNIFPDGGMARLRVYGVAKPTWNSGLVDLASWLNGGLCVNYSNAHFGHPRSLIKPGKASGMSDGWETARRLDRPPNVTVDDNGFLAMPGEEWSIFRLGSPGKLVRVEIDTTFFKGNYPDNIRLEGALEKPGRSPLEWRIILSRRKLSPDRPHTYRIDASTPLVSHVRVVIAPDGGFSRLRIWGYRT